jgi:hypothetical protein
MNAAGYRFPDRDLIRTLPSMPRKAVAARGPVLVNVGSLHRSPLLFARGERASFRPPGGRPRGSQRPSLDVAPLTFQSAVGMQDPAIEFALRRELEDEHQQN